MKTLLSTCLLSFCFGLFTCSPARAEYIDMNMAVLRTLDKVTGRTATINLKIGETAAFGTLNIKANVCKTKPPEETPENAAFLEIYNTERRDAQPNRIFSGWMFSSSPALSALENAVYDVWLVKCGGDSVPNYVEQVVEDISDDSEPEVVIENNENNADSMEEPSAENTENDTESDLNDIDEADILEKYEAKARVR